MLTSSDSSIEAYILYLKRYSDVRGSLKYPDPSNYIDYLCSSDKNSFCIEDINDFGDFVRAFKTLDEAKEGAAARCGLQALNRETVLKDG